MMSPMSAEASVLRNYIDWMISVPWKKRTRVKHDLVNAENTLNEDHHGLDEVKERILEFLAVQKRVKKAKGSSALFGGAPGGWKNVSRRIDSSRYWPKVYTNESGWCSR